MVRTYASKTVLDIYCKSFLIYLGMKSPTIRIIAIRIFIFKGLASLLDKLLFNSEDNKKLKSVIKKHFMKK